MPAAGFVSWFVTLAAFFIVGYLLSARTTLAGRLNTRLIVLGLLALVAPYIGVGTALVSIMGFAVYLNVLVHGLVLGAFLGLILRSLEPVRQ